MLENDIVDRFRRFAYVFCFHHGYAICMAEGIVLGYTGDQGMILIWTNSFIHFYIFVIC